MPRFSMNDSSKKLKDAEAKPPSIVLSTRITTISLVIIAVLGTSLLYHELPQGGSHLSSFKSVHDKSRLLEQDDKSLLGHGPSFNRTPLEQSISVSGSHNSKQIRDNYGDFNGELGKCENYAILGSSAVTFAGVIGEIAAGDIGVYPGTSITVASGSIQQVLKGDGSVNNDDKVECSTNRAAVLVSGLAATCTGTGPVSPILVGGYVPGVYCFYTLGMTASTTLTLNDNSVAHPQWVFVATTTFITGANAKVLINGGDARNVYWIVGTSATLGANTQMQGTILAAAAITLGTGASIIGHALAGTAVTCESGCRVSIYTAPLPVGPPTEAPVQPPPPPFAGELKTCDSFAVLASSTVTFSGAMSSIPKGNVGVYPGTSITVATGTINQVLATGVVPVDRNSAKECVATRTELISAGVHATCTSNPMPALVGSYSPGVHCAGTFTMAGTVILNNPDNIGNPKWVFVATTTFITGANAKVTINGGDASNVYWIVGTSATIGLGTQMQGTILAAAAITLGTGSSLIGHALAGTAITCASNCHVSTTLPAPTDSPTASPPFDFKLDACTDFAILGSTAVTFAGVLSTVPMGNVGVYPGTAITVAGGTIAQVVLDPSAGSLTNIKEQCSRERGVLIAAGNDETCSSTTPADKALGGGVYPPGVYCAGTFSIAYATTVTLKNDNLEVTPKWVFVATTTFITGAGAKVAIINGDASNVFWVIGTSVTMGASTEMQGSLLAAAAITLGGSSRLTGHALAGTAVTCESNCYVSTKLIPTASPTSAPAFDGDLGDCENFAVLGSTAVTFAGVLSNVAVGDVGVYPGTAITVAGGFINQVLSEGVVIKGANSKASKCADKRAVLINSAAHATCTTKPSILVGVYKPGVYCMTTFSMTASTILALDNTGDDAVENPMWVFVAATTFITGANAKVAINGGDARNVYWIVGTSATMGASTQMQGTILAAAAITLGGSASLIGHALAGTAVTCSSDCHVSIYKAPVPTAAPTTPPPFDWPLYSCTSFAILGSSTVTFAGVMSTVAEGNVGVYPGTSITVAGGNIGQVVQKPSTWAAAASSCSTNRKVLIAAGFDAICTGTKPTSSLLIGVYEPGVYCFGTLSMNHDTTLTLKNLDAIENPKWVFVATTTFITGINAKVVLDGADAIANNVLWVIGTSATIGANTQMQGTLLAAAAITLNSGSRLIGRALAGTAVTCESECYVSTTLIPTMAPSLPPPFNGDLGECDKYAILGSTAVTFAGVPSTVGGNVGVYPGPAITVAQGTINQILTGSGIVDSANAESCTATRRVIFNSAVHATCIARPSILVGEFYPGVYCMTTFSIAASTTLYLTNTLDVEPTWVFVSATTFITGANAKVVISGGDARNVYWIVGTSATMGASTQIQGTILAAAAITLGGSASLIGRALAGTAVTCSANCRVNIFRDPFPTSRPTMQPSTPSSYPTSVPTSSPTYYPSFHGQLKSCDEFAIFGSSAITFDGLKSDIPQGNVGIYPGTSITVATGSLGEVITNGEVPADRVSAKSCATTRLDVIVSGLNAPCTDSTRSVLSGSLEPGVYCAGTFWMAAGAKLDLVNTQIEPHPEWVFVAATTFITGAGAEVTVSGGHSDGVFWIVGTSATIGATTKMKGIILAAAAVTLNTGAEVIGHVIAGTAVTCASNCRVNLGHDLGRKLLRSA